MKLDNLVELLECVPLFDGLSHEQLTRLAFEGEKVLIHSERPIISKDQPGDAAYLVVAGKALRLNGPGINGQPEVLGAGTFIGEMAMLISSSYGSTIVAYGEVKALRFSYAQMQSIMHNDVGMAQHFAEHMQSRFMSFKERLNEVQEEMFGGSDQQQSPLAFTSGTDFSALSKIAMYASQSLQ